MAREIRMLLVVCVCILIQGNVAADKCVVCRKNVRGKTDVRCDGLYCTDFEACFKISDSLQSKISER